MYSPIHLDHSTILTERPFTHPDQSWGDLAHLRTLAEKLCDALNRAEAVNPRTVFIEWQGADPPDCRIVVANAEELRANTDLSLVGFFGHKRGETDLATTMEAEDEALIQEFVQHPGVLSYCSQQLEAGNWGNLVVLGSPEAREHWRTSERHAQVVRELAPRYYHTVRLHNAVLPGGLFSGQEWRLQRTKYYDFQAQPPWFAIREF